MTLIGNYFINTNKNLFLGIVYVGMSLYSNEKLTMGDITSFVIYTIHLSESLRDLNNSYSSIFKNVPLAMKIISLY